MNDVNWWLMALSFLFGFVLTLVLVIRRATREVPVYASGARVTPAAGPATAAKFTGSSAESAGRTTKPTTADESPYGEGSLRLASASKAAPSGYPIKGNEDSMLYHTTDSPSYEQTIAEVWFADEESAAKAGFTPWHRGKKK